MAPRFTQAAIVGVGLIGGSLGMILRRRGLAAKVVGVGRRLDNLKTAIEVGAIDRYVVDPAEAIQDADLVVLATPVDTYDRHLKEWASRLKPGAIVTDVGSVKGALVEQSEKAMPPGVHFVGAHPIAGKEKTGAAAGSEDLFMGARCILTPTRHTTQEALERVREIWEATGSVVLTMDPHMHDQILGAVSHLPHVAAFALINALIDIRGQLPALDLVGHSGGGLRDTTRIAASSPEMWRDIFLWNRDNLVRFIESYEQALGRLKGLIRTGDASGIEKELERAKQERDKFPARPATRS
ncbi:prephenate dehydrogenase [Nitrospira sp. KM1]|uniref:prephenate dehydrogenase n=1 Tax=Nitrospira sp. KM1 TaxID=1936990 RepID=UPI0013A75E64|nr:prephenate dehydrogenase/arogenate dehydrogenase family protein [Nitrospira sp. KM1]BCA55560.1 prephenate dehydrogenase [Nitrospira sp. KM1]